MAGVTGEEVTYGRALVVKPASLQYSTKHGRCSRTGMGDSGEDSERRMSDRDVVRHIEGGGCPPWLLLLDEKMGALTRAETLSGFVTDKRSFTWLRLPRRRIKRRRIERPVDMYGHVPEWSILDALRQYEALRESNHVSR